MAFRRLLPIPLCRCLPCRRPGYLLQRRRSLRRPPFRPRPRGPFRCLPLRPLRRRNLRLRCRAFNRTRVARGTTCAGRSPSASGFSDAGPRGKARSPSAWRGIDDWPVLAAEVVAAASCDCEEDGGPGSGLRRPRPPAGRFFGPHPPFVPRPAHNDAGSRMISTFLDVSRLLHGKKFTSPPTREGRTPYRS